MTYSYSNLEQQRRCIELQELIYELSDKAGINRDEAISFTSYLFSSIKDHLLQGHNINLGELGVLTHHPITKGQATEIRYTPSLDLLRRLNSKKKICTAMTI